MHATKCAIAGWLAVLAIGPTTADAVVRRGGIPATAPTSDREGLLRALRDWEFHT